MIFFYITALWVHFANALHLRISIKSSPLSWLIKYKLLVIFGFCFAVPEYRERQLCSEPMTANGT